MRTTFITIFVLITVLTLASVAVAKDHTLNRYDHGRLKKVSISVSTDTSVTWKNPVTRIMYMATPKKADNSRQTREIIVSVANEQGVFYPLLTVKVFRDISTRKLIVEEIY